MVPFEDLDEDEDDDFLLAAPIVKPCDVGVQVEGNECSSVAKNTRQKGFEQVSALAVTPWIPDTLDAVSAGRKSAKEEVRELDYSPSPLPPCFETRGILR